MKCSICEDLERKIKLADSRGDVAAVVEYSKKLEQHKRTLNHATTYGIFGRFGDKSVDDED